MERESRTLEYKRQATDYEAIAKTVAAFANGDGGQLVIGVDDKTRAVLGLSPEIIDSLLERLPVSLADRIHPPLFPRVFEKTTEGKEVLVIQVYPGSQKPYCLASEGLEKGVYVRVGAHTRRAAGETLEELKLLRRRIGYDEQPLPNCSIDELDLSSLPEDMRTEKALISLDIAWVDSPTGALYPTRGGVLMFHREPHRCVSEAYILCSRMRGTSGRDTVETHEVVGPLPAQLERTAGILESWLARNPTLRGVRYVTRQTALPMAAVREALANALFHRQYSIPGAIKVALYADRLEVFSPGHFAGPFIPDALGDGTSYIRNRVVALLARRLHLIEKRGTGIRLILDSMSDLHKRAEFVEGTGWFKVVLHLTAHDEAVGEPEELVLRLFEDRGEISSSDVCELLNVSRATAVSVLDRMMHAHRIVRIGKGPRTRYRIAGY